MKRGERRQLLILLLVFAVLLIAGLVITTQQANQPQPEYPFLRVFPEVNESDIVAVRLRDPNTEQAFTMTRAEDGIWVTPEGVPLNENGILIARTLALLPYDRILTILPNADITEYGFAPNGTLRVEIILTDGAVHGVAIGGLASTNLTYYALVDDQPEIYIILRPAVEYLIAQLRNPPTA